jgi:hypothetical protein
MKAGFNPARRNRNIGTSKQGHGQNNRLVIPDICLRERRWAEQLNSHQQFQRVVSGREVIFIVEEVSGGCTHSCTIEDTERGAEFNLIPLLKSRQIPAMAYSPIGQGRLPHSPALSAIAKRHGVTPFSVALAWVLRDPTVIAIPKAGDLDHLKANRAALDLQLTSEDLAAIDAEFPPPSRKSRLAML